MRFVHGVPENKSGAAPTGSGSVVDPKYHHTMPLVLSCVATFLLIAYTTIVTVAVPTVAEDLGVGFGVLQWVIDVYTIALATLLVPIGSLSDRVDRTVLLATGFGLFAMSSLMCAAATDATVLTLGRCAQGIAAAMMFATTLPLLEASYRGRARAVAFSIWGAVSGLAAAAGNVIGGLLSVFGWRAMFVMAVPVTSVAAVVSLRMLPRQVVHQPRPVDRWGMVLLSVGVGTLVVTALLLADGAPPWQITMGTVLCIISVVWFVVHERRAGTPVFPASMVTRPGFVAAVLVAVVYYCASFGPLPVVSQWLQEEAGRTAVGTAAILSIQPILFFAVSAVFGPRLGRVTRRIPFMGGLVLCGVGCAAFLLVVVVPGWPALLPAMMLTGVGAGMISPVLPAAAMAGMPPDQTGVASTAMNAARQLGISIGVAGCAWTVRVTREAGHGWGVGVSATGLAAGLLCFAAAGLVGWILRRRSDDSVGFLPGEQVAPEQ